MVFITSLVTLFIIIIVLIMWKVPFFHPLLYVTTLEFSFAIYFLFPFCPLLLFCPPSSCSSFSPPSRLSRRSRQLCWGSGENFRRWTLLQQEDRNDM